VDTVPLVDNTSESQTVAEGTETAANATETSKEPEPDEPEPVSVAVKAEVLMTDNVKDEETPTVEAVTKSEDISTEKPKKEISAEEIPLRDIALPCPVENAAPPGEAPTSAAASDAPCPIQSSEDVSETNSASGIDSRPPVTDGKEDCAAGPEPLAEAARVEQAEEQAPATLETVYLKDLPEKVAEVLP